MKKDYKFEVGDHFRVSISENIFPVGCILNWSEEDFVIKKVKVTVPWTFVIEDINGEERLAKMDWKKKSNRAESWKSNQEKMR